MKKWTTAVLMLTLFSCSTGARKSEADCACAADTLIDGKIARLVLGTNKFVDLAFEPPHAGVFVGNPSVLGATIAKSAGKVQLVLQPLKAGATNLTVMDSKGEIKFQQQYQVTSTDLVDLANQLTELLKDTKEASVKLMKDKVVIDGNLVTVAQSSRIAAILQDKHYADHVLNLTRLSPQFFADLAARAQDEIKKVAPNATVRAVNDQLWLEGKAETADQANRAAKMASLLLPEVLPQDPLAKQSDTETLPPRSRVQNFVTVGK